MVTEYLTRSRLTQSERSHEQRAVSKKSPFFSNRRRNFEWYESGRKIMQAERFSVHVADYINAKQ